MISEARGLKPMRLWMLIKNILFQERAESVMKRTEEQRQAVETSVENTISVLNGEDVWFLEKMKESGKCSRGDTNDD